MKRNERIKVRNNNIRTFFTKTSKKHPKWRTDAIIEDVAKEFFLSTRTIEAILKGEGNYSF